MGMKEIIKTLTSSRLMTVMALSLVICQLSFSHAGAQSARSILDKTAAVLSNKDGVTANFTMTNSQKLQVSGTVAVKGIKLYAKTQVGIIWFDGKTQWTYLTKNDEVSVTTPTAAQLQTINPYTFINMYRDGYKYTLNKSGSEYNVHLTATDPKRKIQEMFINVDKKTYAPTQVKLLQGNKWTLFDISGVKQQKLNDGMFRFSSKDFPNAEVIDLR